MNQFMMLFKRYPKTTLLSAAIAAPLTYLVFGQTLGLIQYTLGFAAANLPSAVNYAANFGLGALVCAASYKLVTLVQDVTSFVDGMLQFEAFCKKDPSTALKDFDKAKANEITDALLISPEIIATQIVSSIRVKGNFEKYLEDQFANACSMEEVRESSKDLMNKKLIKIIKEKLEGTEVPRDRKKVFLKLCKEILEERYFNKLEQAVGAYIEKYAVKKGNYLLGTEVFGEELTQSTNPYSVLQLEQNATTQEINAAFRKMSIMYHPDKNGGKQSPMWEKIIKAKNILLHAQCRINLDRILAENGIHVSQQLRKDPNKDQDTNHNTNNVKPLAPALTEHKIKSSGKDVEELNFPKEQESKMVMKICYKGIK